MVYHCFFCKENGKKKKEKKHKPETPKKRKKEEDNSSDSGREYYERDYDVEEVQDKRVIDVLEYVMFV